MLNHFQPEKTTWSVLVLTILLVSLTGCTLNTATGKRQLTLIDEQQEISMGQEYNQTVLGQYGLYQDEKVQNYVKELGHKLAAVCERPNLPWEFYVIDDDTVNAFAVPGGYIYLTRGILAHFNSEAQLATVMGHEIGHVTARHSVEQISRAQLAQLGVGIAMVASENFREYAGLAQLGLGVLFLKFSRDDESQSDKLGMRYLLKAGYDPREAPKVFEMLGKHSAAQGYGRLPEWQATHPSPDRRAAKMTERVKRLPVEKQTGTVNREKFLDMINGITFGSDPTQGYSIGSTFYHPGMAFQMDFPKDWQIVNQAQMVAGVSPKEDAYVLLQLAQGKSVYEAEQNFFSQEGIQKGASWGNGFTQFTVTPQSDAMGNTSTPMQGTVGFINHRGIIFQLASCTSSDQWFLYNQPMQQALFSFRQLTNRTYLDVQAKRIEIVKLNRPMTLQEFNRSYPSTIQLEELAVLNGVDVQSKLDKGTLVKRVTGADPPTQ
ncbi:MAG: peptidase M48 [Acidobacteria bacterium]|nr:MAG: peptidase M48 [Acidobacteriota bacterium]